MKREIYPRHKAKCPNGKAKRPRKKFDGCRVYARSSITDPHTGLLLEEFNGALPPHITTKDAADMFVNQRFALIIEKHQRGDKVATINRGATVKEAGSKYITEQKRHFGKLEPFQISENVRRTQERLKIGPDDRQHEIVEKLGLLFAIRFPAFSEEHNIRYIRDVEYDHLTAFLDAQPGRVVTEIIDGIPTKAQKPQSHVTWNKNMESVKRFFRWLHLEAKLIESNPAERLKAIKLQKPKTPNPRFKEADANKKQWTPVTVNAVRRVIPEASKGTKLGPYVAAIFEVSVYANPRITSTVQIECSNVYCDPPDADDPNREPEYGIVYWEPKNNAWRDAWIPEHVYRMLTALTPKSEKYLFWSGNGDPESWSKRYSAYLLKAFRLAGVPERHQGGPRIHQFRHTNSSGLMDLEQGKIEHAAATLGHATPTDKARVGTTASRFYIDAQAKLQNRRVNLMMRDMFKEKGLWTAPVFAMDDAGPTHQPCAD